ncbi:PGF-CTERM sorting domain-containing protein [Halorarius halobius]|uniref:PGF-CTERM sorting domain-containing protein n=1 Tax=Halorarius halobius TaxID=2962671 RepID=UPI0020CF9618|nr:PGF-CTERM sorting domain-containing protein [Halorarius halobius]
MTDARNRSRSLFLVALVAVTVAGVGLVAATGSVAADHDSSANYTVHLPQEKGHYPKDSADTSIWHLAAVTDSFEDTSSQKGFEEAGTLVIESQAVDFSNCGTSNTAGFGLDRDNDSPGTKTDQDLLQHREDSSFNDHSIVVKFFDEGDLAGSPVSINANDQIIAVQNDCYNMPNEPGWYQIFGSLNGTGYDGSNFEVAVNSHYYYICECDSRQQAVETLGPPPSAEGSGSTPTATPSGSTATPTATPEPTDTPTPTTTPQPQQSTSTPESDTSDDEPTATATSRPQQNQGNQQESNQGNQQGSNQQPAQRTATGTGDAVPVTPTVAEGPGFGAAAALVALVGAAVVALRRTR